MPSIGLALHAGRQMWESERKEKETNDRFLAERKLFDAQLKEQEAAAEYLNQANEQARSAKKSILNNRERILIGDPTGTANVLRDTVYRDFDGKVTVDPTTKEVIIIDKDGKEVGRQQPLMGMDGVAKLMQLGNTIDQTYAANVAAQQTAQQRAYEMTKMREEKGFDYKNRNIRIKFMGDRTVLDEKLQQLMNKLEADSSVKTGMTLNIAINYGGRPEIVRAAQQLAEKAAAGQLKPEEITEQMLSDAMYTAGQKDPDFILRPSGEKRLSNFMLWQAAYAELVEMDVLWPDFTRADLDAAIEEFNHRSRRFGGL